MYKLVIIDDEQKIVEGMKNLFPWEEIGFEVVAYFSDSLKAIDYINQHKVDVILRYIEMQGMKGIEI